MKPLHSVQVPPMTITGSNLPPEVWTRVLEEVPQPHLPALLGVCSQFHDIAIRRLFASIKVYFMGGKRAQKMLNTNDAYWVDSISIDLMRKSWEILNHIRQDRRFARVVKSVTVIAFADGLSIFERMTLTNTITFIPNLHTFRWIGNGPEFDTSVAECLPGTLKRLCIQSSLPTEPFHHLTKLQHLELPTPFFFPDDEEAHDRLVVDEELAEITGTLPIGDLLYDFPSELCSLRLCSFYIQNIPVRICNTLTELDLLMTIGDEEELVGLDAVFRHATVLESLSIVGFVSPLIFSFLENAATTMPFLASFRFSNDMTEYSYQDVAAISTFLVDRPLRRLFLRVPAIRNNYSSLISFISANQHLEVLGLHTGVNTSDTDILATVLRLPRTLRALHLAMDWRGSDMLQLVDFIGQLPKLSFLHLYGVVTRLPVLLDDLAIEATGLQMVGLNRALWNIDRVGDELFFNKLPRWRIKFAVDEDFLCDDDAWLFKYN